MNKNGNIILNSLTEIEKQTHQISETPAGYIEVKLSTKGKVGAPEIVHVRNFKVSEILALSISDQMELPSRLINILNDMIIEDTDVSTWHEKEVEELILYIFMTYYKGTMEDIPFPLNEEDMKYIKSQPNGEEKVKDIEEGKYVPKTSIVISEAVDTYELVEDFTPRITITNKKTGFYVTFDFIKYGDQIVIKNWMDSFFRNEETRFESIKNKLEYNKGIANQLKDSPSALDNLIAIDEKEEAEYKDFVIKKVQVITDVSRIISIVDFNGQDVSKLSVGEKYDLLATDARIDYNLIAKLTKRQDKMPFGIKPDVSMKNPITGEVVKRPMSFRISAIIQAMQLSGNDDYDDGFDD